MANCRGCNAPIMWAITEEGKRAPLDPAPSTAGCRQRTSRSAAGRPRVDTGASEAYADRQMDYYWRMRALGAGRNHPDVVAAVADRFRPTQMVSGGE